MKSSKNIGRNKVQWNNGGISYGTSKMSLLVQVHLREFAKQINNLILELKYEFTKHKTEIWHNR